MSDFAARGGKLVQYHGWADALIPTENSINYYESVAEQAGGLEQAREFHRLFLVPGMGHCGGGPGPNSVDWTAALDRWRASGEAPAQLMGRNPQTGLERPICPYPQYAKYDGSGNLQDASNWRCAAP